MRILALDVGTKRIGVAFADTSVRIAVPRPMIPANGNELGEIAKQFSFEKADLIVAGFPRNNQGEETAQTKVVQNFIISLKDYFVKHKQKAPLMKYQDETLTSVTAEQYLTANSHEFSRQDRASGKLDSEAAAIILEDFMTSMDEEKLTEELKHAR